MVFLRFPFTRGVQCVQLGHDFIGFHDVKKCVSANLGSIDFELHYNGKRLKEEQIVPQDATIHITFTLPGGKGGFGSMLRAIGAQIEKTTNREACRDLSGRRLRDINEEQRLKKWISKESEREADKMRRRKERIERLKTKPKHNFVDFEYEKEISALPDRIDEALTEGMQKAGKRPVDKTDLNAPSTSKKKCLWLDEELSNSSGSDSETLKDTSSKEASQSSSVSGEEDTSNSTPCLEAQPSHPFEEETPSICPENTLTTDEPSLTQKETETKTESAELTEEKDKTSSCPSESEIANTEVVTTPVDLLSHETAESLEDLGLEHLKKELSERGLKCGGSLRDRAKRLWSVRGLSPELYPANALARK